MPAVVAWLAGLGVLAVPGSGSAALITVTGTITVNADDGASFKAGDTFDYSFTFNDATTDTSSSTFNAQFNAGVSAFSRTRGVSNTGTWNPASGTFNVSPLSNMSAGQSHLLDRGEVSQRIIGRQASGHAGRSDAARQGGRTCGNHCATFDSFPL